MPADVLQNWGWPAPPLSGPATLQLKLNARLAADTPLKGSANGTLTINAAERTRSKP